jgi:hypothetical protein
MIAPISDQTTVSDRGWHPSDEAMAPPDVDTGRQNQDADKEAFSALMASSPGGTVLKLDPVSRTGAPSMIEQFAATQNADMRDLLQSGRDMLQMAPHMSMAEVVAFGNEMTMKIAITTTQFNVAGNFGKSAGKGIETLMRNQ